MIISIRRCAVLTLLFASSTMSTIALAQEAGLPGGASSLNERYSDWTVACNVIDQGEGPVRICGLTQQQVNAEGMHVLSIELLPDPSGAVGNLVLPFGLDLAKGVNLSVDEAQMTQALPYATCLPVGCLVELRFSSDVIGALRSGATLSAQPSVLGGDSADFAISLAGFSAAYKRASELLN